MKRISLYDTKGVLLWSGNLIDLPLDPAAVTAELQRVYGAGCTCPDRRSIVRQMIRTRILDSGNEREGTIRSELSAFLTISAAVRYTLSDI